jgi:hypothetical protein
MPTEDRLGRDEERCPPLTWHQLRQRGDERPVGPGEAGTGDLAAEDGQLVAKHEDLGVLGGAVHAMDPKQFGHAADQAVQEAERHGPGASPSRSWLVKPKIGWLDPSRSASSWRTGRDSR